MCSPWRIRNVISCTYLGANRFVRVNNSQWWRYGSFNAIYVEYFACTPLPRAHPRPGTPYHSIKSSWVARRPSGYLVRVLVFMLIAAKAVNFMRLLRLVYYTFLAYCLINSLLGPLRATVALSGTASTRRIIDIIKIALQRRALIKGIPMKSSHKL